MDNNKISEFVLIFHPDGTLVYAGPVDNFSDNKEVLKNGMLPEPGGFAIRVMGSILSKHGWNEWFGTKYDPHA